jgi:RimJ/RimL family protein N-acetyltransferase
MSFRELNRGDLSFLVEVRNECRDMLHNDAEFSLAEANEWFDRERPRFYIITNNAAPIGYFRTSNWDDQNRHVYVGCDLHKDCRGKGLAQQAYPVFLRFLFERSGINKVSLEVLEHNIRGRRLYDSLGFKLESVRRQDVHRGGRYLDSTLMSMLKHEFMTRYGNEG